MMHCNCSMSGKRQTSSIIPRYKARLRYIHFYHILHCESACISRLAWKLPKNLHAQFSFSIQADQHGRRLMHYVVGKVPSKHHELTHNENIFVHGNKHVCIKISQSGLVKIHVYNTGDIVTLDVSNHK